MTTYGEDHMQMVDDETSDPPDTRTGAPDDPYHSTGMEVAAVLRSAHDAALEMAQRAEEDAARTRAEAEAAGNRIRTEAEDEARRIRTKEREDDDRRRRDLEQEFARARLVAEEDERRRRDEAEAEMLRQGERVRADLKGALDQFAAESVAQIRDGISRIESDHHHLLQSIEEASTWVERRLSPAGDLPPVEPASRLSDADASGPPDADAPEPG
jgi:hypothetical protein